MGQDDNLSQGWGAAQVGGQGRVNEALGDAAAEEPVVAALGGAEGGEAGGFGGSENRCIGVFFTLFA